MFDNKGEERKKKKKERKGDEYLSDFRHTLFL